MEEYLPQQPTPADTPKPNFKRFALDLLETVGLALILFFAINAVSARVRVDGFSMLPTLQNGELVLVNRLAFKNDLPERGDIIVFHSLNSQEDLIKRVIGLPGEQVRIESGTVFINGTVLGESYIAQNPVYSGSWEVPAGSLFVLGDNRNDSSDSHSWGFLPIDRVVGKAIMIYWPFTNFMILQHAGNAAAAP